VINFAYGAIAGYVAYTYSALRAQGELLIPPLPNPLLLAQDIAGKTMGARWNLPHFPTFVKVSGPEPFAAAFAISLLTAVLLALIMHFLVFRPLRDAPPLAKVVATVGIMLILEALIVMRFGSNPVSVASILPTTGIHMFGSVVTVDNLLLAAMAVVLATGLWALFRFTRLGLALRATAENPKGATLLGISPNFQSGLSWVIASVVAGAIGILAAPLTSLTPQNYTLFIIPAFGAALIGGFRSFGTTVAAGLILGIADQWIVLVMSKPWWSGTSWLPQQGVQEMFPFLVIIATLIIRGRGLPGRGAIREGRLPFVPRPKRVAPAAVVLLAVTVTALLLLGFGWRNAIMTSLIGAMIALSLVVLVGFVGQVSLAQLAVAGFGAFALAQVASNWGVPFPFAPLLAILIATAGGTLVSIPALRVRGVQLAAVTLGLAYGLDELIFNDPGLTSATAPPPRLFGLSFGPFSHFPTGDGKVPTAGFGLYLAVVTVLLSLAVVNLRRSPTGRRMLAVRSSERAASGAGINVAQTKLAAFAISSFIAATAGTCLMYFNGGQVGETPFDVFVSLSALATAYIGGITSVSGALIAGALASGGLVFFAIDEIVNITSAELLLAGVGVVLTAVLNPDGIAGAFRVAMADQKRKRSAARPAVANLSLAATEGRQPILSREPTDADA